MYTFIICKCLNHYLYNACLSNCIEFSYDKDHVGLHLPPYSLHSTG